MDGALEAWGYTPKSGLGRVVLAALKKYGLIDEEGTGDKRRIRLSESGWRVVVDEEEGSEFRREFFQEAALRPSIHAELWQEFGSSGLPSDSNLRRRLTFDRGFTESAARDFVPQFRRTLEFAGLLGGDAAPETSPDKSGNRPETSTGSQPFSSSPAFEAPQRLNTDRPPMYLPIAPNEYALIQADFPLTEPKWEQMLAVLQAMKPALVAAVPAQSEEAGKER